MASTTSTTAIKLIEHPLSSYVQKVKIALREKGVPFTTEVPNTLASGSQDGPFFAANPRLEVPVLIDGDVSIFESTIILEYIEEKWPDPPLLPRDPADRAFARMTEEICDTQYEAVNWGLGELRWFKRASGELADNLKAEAVRHTAILQKWFMDRLGSADWFNGETFGWADAAVAPIVNRSVFYGLGPPKGSTLAKWHARIRERPSVAATFAEFDAAALAMSDVAKLYISGERKREYRDHRLEWMIKSGGIDVVLTGMQDKNIRFSWPGDA